MTNQCQNLERMRASRSLFHNTQLNSSPARAGLCGDRGWKERKIKSSAKIAFESIAELPRP